MFNFNRKPSNRKDSARCGWCWFWAFNFKVTQGHPLLCQSTRYI